MPDQLILASSSPRRKELLKNCNIKFKTVSHTFDENSVKIKNMVKLVKEIAYGKAKSIADKDAYKDQYVLGVDTIVVLGRNILGKPKDRDEAEKFVRALSGKKHKVISGISLINNERSVEITKYSISYVEITKINEQTIKYYLDNDFWKGYAGGYAIQSFFGLLVKKIKGSYSNIVGLPVNLLNSMLEKVDFNILW